MLAGGNPGTFYFRATGEQGRPITLKAIPGEKASIDGMGETLKVGFVLYGKHHYRVDSLYFDGYAGIEDNVAGEQAALFVRDARTCKSPAATSAAAGGGLHGGERLPGPSPELRLHAAWRRRCSFTAGLRVENCVFISPLIHHILVSNAADGFRGELHFGENTRHKVHPLQSRSAGRGAACFHVRLSGIRPEAVPARMAAE